MRNNEVDSAQHASGPTGHPETVNLTGAPEPFTLIAPDGTQREHSDPQRPGFPTPEVLRSLYAQMVRARRFDAQATALARQGRIATYPSAFGQEAAEIAAAAVLGPGDWLFPSYRDSAALLSRGLGPEEILSLFRGQWPGGYDPISHRVAPQSTPLATQALHAVGLGTAAKLRGERIMTLAMLGDGASSEGDTHEALNFASVWQSPTVFLIQNNGYAISVPFKKQSHARSLADRGVGYGMPAMEVDGNDAAAMYAVLAEAADRARAGGGPTLIEARTYRLEAHTNSDNPARYREKAEATAWAKRDPIERLRTYLVNTGELSEEMIADIALGAEELATEIRAAMNIDPPNDPLEMFDHVTAHPSPRLTEQRRALAAELRERGIEASPEATQQTPTAQKTPEYGPAGPAENLALSASLTRALRDAMRADPNVVVFGADVGPLGGVFRVTDGLHDEFGEQRIWDTPAAESGIVGTAIGMAMHGFRPVIEMQFDAFSYPAFEQIVSHVAKMRNRTRGRVSLPIVIRIPYGGNIGGVEHHSDSSEAYWAHTPGLTVVSPSNPADAYSMLREAIEGDDPVIFLEPKSRYWEKQELALPDHTEPMRQARVIRQGSDVTLIAYGPLVQTALETAELAEEEGLSIEVIDLRSLAPFDEETVGESLRKTSRAAIVHEAAGFGGYGAEVAARLTEREFFHLAAPILRITGYDIPYPSPNLEEYYVPTPDRILTALDGWEWETP